MALSSLTWTLQTHHSRNARQRPKATHVDKEMEDTRTSSKLARVI